jgi:dUTP pyrophosphatase
MTEDLYVKFCNVFDNFVYLKIKVDSDNDELQKRYISHINKHNTSMLNDPHYYNSGFDLLISKDQNINNSSVNKIDHEICCSMLVGTRYTGYYMYPRSSVSKTPMRLANSVGIIDAGYRGHLIAMVDSSIEQFQLHMGERYFQICAPNLCPIYVELVYDLGDDTNRGTGGFGSTGR